MVREREDKEMDNVLKWPFNIYVKIISNVVIIVLSVDL